MKTMKYRGWEVYFFSQCLGKVICYFCSAPEIQAVSEGLTYWDAFLNIRERLDDVQDMVECDIDYDDWTPPF